MRVLILGGTGVISRAIVQQLLLDQHEVVIFNRGNKMVPYSSEVEHIIGDRHHIEQFEKQMQKQKFDVVIDMIGFNRQDAQTTVRIFGERTEHLIVCSSVAAYQRPLHSIPTIEAQESLIDEPTFLYGYQKAEMERYLHKVIQERSLPITIIRPSLTFGIGSENIGVLRQNYGIVDRIRKGKPLVMFGDGTTPWNFTFAADLAKAFVFAMGNPATHGKAYHVTNGDLHYWEDLYLEFGRIVGVEPNIVHISTQMLTAVAPQLFGHIDDEKKYPSVFDCRKFSQDVPAFQSTISLEQGLKSIVHWYEETHHAVDFAKDELEDKLVELHQEWISQVGNMYPR